MAKDKRQLLAFNRGVISSRGLARIDLERMAMSSERQRNWIPRVLGSMMLRPGLEFIDRTSGDTTSFARQIPFTFGVDDNAQLEFSTAAMRVRIDDVLIERPSVTTAIGNDSFDVGLSPWVDISDAAGVVQALSLGDVKLKGANADFGRIEQEVTVIVADEDVEHAVKLDIEYGNVLFKIGSTSGDDDLFGEQRLGKGVHSLSFTPSGNFFIQIAHEKTYFASINECSIEPAGDMELLTDYSSVDLPFLRYDQSGDVIYVACKNASTTGLAYRAEIIKKIERRGDGRSWSIVDYLPEDGPFRVQNTSGVTMGCSPRTGDATLTASEPFFQSGLLHVGALFRIASDGQIVSASCNAQDIFTDPPVRITGSGDSRAFGIVVTGIFTATVTLQFSFTGEAPWTDSGKTYTAAGGESYNDGQEGQIIYYRIGVKTGDYTSGTAVVQLNYTGGSIQGVCRIRSVTSSTSAQVQVLSPFGSTFASSEWWESEWSYYRGYPTTVSLHEGRLWWAGSDKIWGSISDSYESFDDEFIGDAAPISRSIGFGPIRVIHWLISMGRLLFGTASNSANVDAARIDGNDPLGARSSSDSEPLTTTNFNIKTISTKSVFVDRSEQRLYELTYGVDEQDYRSLDLSVFCPDYNTVGIVQIAIQMKPDVRVHCVRADGTVGLLIFDRLENVVCWVDVDSSGAGGLIEDVSVLPGRVEDQVYYIVKRTINGLTQRHLCKWAHESEAIGGQLNKMADSFVTYEGAATVTPFTTELLHLRGETVVIWADGLDVGTDVVTAGGALTTNLAVAASSVVVGLPYTAQFKSSKLSEITGIGLLERKKVNKIGFVAENMHYQGLKYGPDFSNLSDMPKVSRAQVQPVGQIYETYHEDDFSFGGTWNEDSRICLQAAAPRPCTILAAVAEIESVEYTAPARRRR